MANIIKAHYWFSSGLMLNSGENEEIIALNCNKIKDEWIKDDKYLKSLWDTNTEYCLTKVEYGKEVFWTFRFLIGTLCMVIGCTMLFHKKFKRHPYRLYAIDLIFLSGRLIDVSEFLYDFDAFGSFLNFMNFLMFLLRIPNVPKLKCNFMKGLLFWSWA